MRKMALRNFIAMVLLAACGAASAAECYVSHCHTDNGGTLWCDNQEIDCCRLQSLTCESRSPDNCADSADSRAASEEGAAHIECSTPEGHRVEIDIRPSPREPVEVSPEWTRGGFAGHGNFTGYWGNGGHYQIYRLAPDMVNVRWY